MKKSFRSLVASAFAASLLLAASIPGAALANDKKSSSTIVMANGDIALAQPNLQSGKPVMAAIAARKSVRNFSDKKVSDQDLSNIVWAANGINRRDNGGITIPTAMGSKELDLYVMTERGVFFYDQMRHALLLIQKGDHRELAGAQEFAKTAPLTLLFVIDYDRSKVRDVRDRDTYAAMTAAYASENVYLYCSGTKTLGTVARGSFDGFALGKLLNLRRSQRVLLAQSVGHEASAQPAAKAGAKTAASGK